MALKVVQAEARWMPAVRALNARLAAAGSAWGFYDRPESAWIPADGGGLAERRHWLLVNEESGTVHGGYVLRTEPALLDGEPVTLGNVQGPVSEGLIDRRFALAGPLLIRDSLVRAPLQIGWGTSARKAALLQRGGWSATRVPLFLRPLSAGRLAKAAGAARGGPAGRLLALAGASGLASAVAAGAALAAHLGAGLGRGPARAEPVASFGDWAEPVWAAASASGDARLIADRSAASLARLMPPGRWPDAEPVIVRDGRQTIGWVAVRRERLTGHRLFGDSSVATLVDALALPGRAAEVAIAATDRLATEGHDLLAAALTHAVWQRALSAAGFTRIVARRALLLSPALAARLGPAAAAAPTLHLGLLDGDGPRLFAAGARL